MPATGNDVAVSITRAVTRQRIGIGLDFADRLDADRLARGVRLSMDAEPVLGCAFDTSGRRALWRRLPDLDAASAFTVVETDDAGEAMLRFQTDEVSDDGPQVAVTLLRTRRGDVLGIKASHVPVDGQGAKRYAYLLADIYTRLGEDPGYRPAPNLAPRPTANDVWANLTDEQRRAARTAKSWAQPNWPVPAGSVDAQTITYRELALPPERFRELKAYGAGRGATVNDMLLALYFRALILALDPPAGTPLSLMSTADHRRYLPNPDAVPIGMLSLSGPLGIERVDGEPFDATLERVRTAMDAWRRQCYGAAPARDAEKLGRMSYRMAQRLLRLTFALGSKGKTYPYFTNVGVLDESRLGFGGAAPAGGRMYGPSTSGASPVATVSTCLDTLTITMGCGAVEEDVRFTDALLDLLREETDACLAGSPYTRSSQ